MINGVYLFLKNFLFLLCLYCREREERKEGERDRERQRDTHWEWYQALKPHPPAPSSTSSNKATPPRPSQTALSAVTLYLLFTFVLWCVLQCEALIPVVFLFEHLLQFWVVWSPRAYRRHIVIIDYFKLTTTLITNKCLGFYSISQMYIFVFTINLLFLYSFNLL